MQLLVLAYPTEPISITVLSDLALANEEDRQIAKESCSLAEFCGVVASLREKYNANDMMLIGPWNYTSGIIERLQEYFPNDLTLNVLPIPIENQIEEPPEAEKRTESGLILNG